MSQVTHDPDDVLRVTEIKNSLGGDQEVVPLSRPVPATGHIEDWLLALEREMQRTMKDVCREAALECQRGELLEFLEDFTAQFALLGLQFAWTAQVEAALGACKVGLLLACACVFLAEPFSIVFLFPLV